MWGLGTKDRVEHGTHHQTGTPDYSTPSRDENYHGYLESTYRGSLQTSFEFGVSSS